MGGLDTKLFDQYNAYVFLIKNMLILFFIFSILISDCYKWPNVSIQTSRNYAHLFIEVRTAIYMSTL